MTATQEPLPLLNHRITLPAIDEWDGYLYSLLGYTLYSETPITAKALCGLKPRAVQLQEMYAKQHPTWPSFSFVYAGGELLLDPPCQAEEAVSQCSSPCPRDRQIGELYGLPIEPPATAEQVCVDAVDAARALQAVRDVDCNLLRFVNLDGRIVLHAQRRKVPDPPRYLYALLDDTLRCVALAVVGEGQFALRTHDLPVGIPRLALDTLNRMHGQRRTYEGVPHSRGWSWLLVMRLYGEAAPDELANCYCGLLGCDMTNYSGTALGGPYTAGRCYALLLGVQEGTLVWVDKCANMLHFYTDKDGKHLQASFTEQELLAWLPAGEEILR